MKLSKPCRRAWGSLGQYSFERTQVLSTALPTDRGRDPSE